MIRRLAIPAALALMLGACATYDSGYAARDGYYRNDVYYRGDGYYAQGHDGYGDYYYDNPQIIVDEHYAPYWRGPYWGGYSGYGYSPFGFGYGWGYPYSGFDIRFGFGSGGYGGYPYGYYDPWYGYGWYQHRHHHRPHNDGDDHPWTGRTAPITGPAPGLRQQESSARLNPQPNPWGQRSSGAIMPREGVRPPSQLGDPPRPAPRLEQRRYSNAQIPREDQQQGDRDDDGDRRAPQQP